MKTVWNIITTHLSRRGLGLPSSSNGSSHRVVTKGVKQSLKKYGKTYHLLDQYDKGEVSATKYMAEYKRLRTRLRNSSKAS